VRVYDEDGEVILESPEYNLKITSDRTIYIQKKRGKQYKNTDYKIKEGLTSHQKKLYLIMLSEKIQNKKENKNKKEEDTKVNIEDDANEKKF
jgi:hypothetical protein